MAADSLSLAVLELNRVRAIHGDPRAIGLSAFDGSLKSGHGVLNGDSDTLASRGKGGGEVKDFREGDAEEGSEDSDFKRDGLSSA